MGVTIMGATALIIPFDTLQPHLHLTGGIFLIGSGSLSLICLVARSLFLRCRKDEIKQNIPKLDIDVEALYEEYEKDRKRI